MAINVAPSSMLAANRSNAAPGSDRDGRTGSGHCRMSLHVEVNRPPVSVDSAPAATLMSG